ncbi:MATE family efflux transporter [Thalassotalea hakodatensis]|uniref:MATE family efflux transporter n=1 Tax=Thalassotalea hakodatensis TaxID=3030492 RepID=UPI002573C6DC|nr:MATE family efflux transporter [Thalassotalea hakodatensis]
MTTVTHRQLFALAIPMILSNITVPLLGLVDTAVIGHLSHAYYLGGSSVGAMIVTVITWLCGFLRMSTTGLSAQAYGKQDVAQSCKVLVKGVVLAVAIALVVLIFQQAYISLAIELAGASEQVAFYAREYAEIRIWGLPAALINLVLIGWLLGNHQAKAVMWLLIITNMINLLLDLLFVVVFDWQVKGVAYATLIAEYSSLLIATVIVFYYQKAYWRQLTWQIISQYLSLVTLKQYLALNRDILIRTLSLQACFVFITFQGARLGDNVVAANAILMNFLLFISFGLDGIANAAEVLVGKEKGAHKPKMLNDVVKMSLLWTLIFAVAYCLVFFIAGHWMIRLISNIEPVVNFAEQFIGWIIILPIVACWSYLYDGIYIGLTQAKTMRNSMVFSTFGVFFPSWFIFQHLGNHGLWLAFTLFMAARGIALAIDYHRKGARYLQP